MNNSDLLTIACFNNDLEKVKELVKLVNVNRKDSKGNLPIDSAIEGESVGSIRLLAENGLEINSCNSNYDFMVTKGWTPLHVAIEYAEDAMTQNNRPELYPEHEQIIMTLMHNGDDYTVKDDQDKTPLDYTTDLDLKNRIKTWASDFRKRNDNTGL